MEEESHVREQLATRARDDSTEDAVSDLRQALEEERQRRKAVEEKLRETLAAMIQHQQVGKCGNFRYNAVSGAISGTEEVFKMFHFPAGTRGCTVPEWLTKLHPDDLDRIAREFQESVSKESALRFEYRIVVGNGEVKHIRCDGEPDLQAGGELTYFGVLTDVTERRAIEATQRVMEAELAAAHRLASLGELAGSIIHEVRQPLAAIAASSSACRRWITAESDRTDRALASLGHIDAEGLRAAEIISGLKSLIRNVAAEPVPFDLGSATREFCSLILSELSRERILLETKIEKRLPRAIGNWVQIQQVLMNLARNSIEAMRENHARRVLTISAENEGPMLSLRVSDTGPGFKAEEAELLFKPLYTTKKDGMGLGLAISRKIAIAHGGSLHAEPREGGGAEFKLLLPVEQPPRA
jgi:signal transduction histidine kinase